MVKKKTMENGCPSGDSADADVWTLMGSRSKCTFGRDNWCCCSCCCCCCCSCCFRECSCVGFVAAKLSSSTVFVSTCQTLMDPAASPQSCCRCCCCSRL